MNFITNTIPCNTQIFHLFMQIDGAIEHGLMIDSCKDKELTEASLLHCFSSSSY